MVFTQRDTQQFTANINLAGHVIIIRADALNAEYAYAKHQLLLATGGFGCDPNAVGNSIFGLYLADDTPAAICRGDVIGIASPEAISQWKALYGEPKVTVSD